MVQFSTIIKKFGEQGEKTGWTYIEIPYEASEQLKPGNKKSFRVQGKLDNYSYRGIALIPMGGGRFMMALNADIRKKIGKRKGAILEVTIEADDHFVLQAPTEFLECLRDEPSGLDFFHSLAKSHQGYFIKWIETAKTESTKVKRIAGVVAALSQKRSFSEMLRANKKDRDHLLG